MTRTYRSRALKQHKVNHLLKGQSGGRRMRRNFTEGMGGLLVLCDAARTGGAGEKTSSRRGWGAKGCRSCRENSAWIMQSLNLGGDHTPSGQPNRAKEKPFMADDSLTPKGCCDQLPAFRGVLGAGFFFTVASPETKKFTGYFLPVLFFSQSSWILGGCSLAHQPFI